MNYALIAIHCVTSATTQIRAQKTLNAPHGVLLPSVAYADFSSLESFERAEKVLSSVSKARRLAMLSMTTNAVRASFAELLKSANELIPSVAALPNKKVIRVVLNPSSLL